MRAALGWLERVFGFEPEGEAIEMEPGMVHATLTLPADMFWGDRMYAVKDLEGHHWSFAQHVRDVSVEDLVPTAEGE